MSTWHGFAKSSKITRRALNTSTPFAAWVTALRHSSSRKLCAKHPLRRLSASHLSLADCVFAGMERQSHKWFRVWMLTGAGLAILLLASSVINYIKSERATELFHTRRELAREMTVLDQLMHIKKPSAGALSGLLEQV